MKKLILLLLVSTFLIQSVFASEMDYTCKTIYHSKVKQGVAVRKVGKMVAVSGVFALGIVATGGISPFLILTPGLYGLLDYFARSESALNMISDQVMKSKLKAIDNNKMKSIRAAQLLIEASELTESELTTIALKEWKRRELIRVYDSRNTANALRASSGLPSITLEEAMISFNYRPNNPNGRALTVIDFALEDINKIREELGLPNVGYSQVRDYLSENLAEKTLCTSDAGSVRALKFKELRTQIAKRL